MIWTPIDNKMQVNSMIWTILGKKDVGKQYGLDHNRQKDVGRQYGLDHNIKKIVGRQYGLDHNRQTGVGRQLWFGP